MGKRGREKSIKTSIGKITTRVFDYDTVKGVEILIDGLIIVSFDVYREGNACVLVATKNGIERIVIKE